MTIFPLRAIILVFLVALLLLFSSQSMKRKEQTMEISNEDLRVPEMFPVTNESLCSDRAALRGPRQRVVSFNYFGQYNHRRRYFAGIEANAQFLPTYYPDWTMRVYHSVGREDPIWQILYALEEFYPHLDLCDITNLPIPGNLYAGQKNAWRFLPIVDNLVEVFLSRDLDSRISNREVAAVDEWLNSNLSFHVMRDSTYHNVIMLAGMWGVRKDLERELIVTLGKDIHKMILKPSGNCKADQTILKDVVWPAIKGKVLQHDSYYCTQNTFKNNGNMRAWPTRRLNTTSNYVGSIITERDNSQKVCPWECRPEHHKDWVTC